MLCHGGASAFPAVLFYWFCAYTHFPHGLSNDTDIPQLDAQFLKQKLTRIRDGSNCKVCGQVSLWDDDTEMSDGILKVDYFFENHGCSGVCRAGIQVDGLPDPPGTIAPITPSDVQ